MIFHFLRSCIFPPNLYILYIPQKFRLANTFVCFRIVLTAINMEAGNSIVLWPRAVPREGTLHLNFILEVLFILESFFKCRHIIISVFSFSFSVITKKTSPSLFLCVCWLHSSASPQERQKILSWLNTPPPIHGGNPCCHAQEFTSLMAVAALQLETWDALASWWPVMDNFWLVLLRLQEEQVRVRKQKH